MKIPAFVQRSDTGDYVATFPDVPHSFARGNSAAAALEDLRAWLLARWDTSRLFGADVSLYLSPFEQLCRRPEYAHGEWHWIEIELSALPSRAALTVVEQDRRRQPR